MPTPDLSTAVWRKARMSETAQGCVEVADLGDGLIAVRNSSDLARAAHLYPLSDWEDLLAHLRGERPAPDRIVVTITDAGVTLLDSRGVAAQAHEYTLHEWACFLDGVQSREPQLTAA